MIPQMIPYFDAVEADALADYMRSGGFITEFKKTSEFEMLLANFTGSKHAIVVNNGTVSLTLMLLALGIGVGDEVIVPNYTMIATPNAVSMVGANPIFVDVEIDTLCLDLIAISRNITEKTKAIMFVSANGRFPTYEIAELRDLCEAHGLFLLEDAAQGLGSTYPNGLHIGTVGLMGSLSFSVPKIISTGQGGCILTDNDELADKLRKLKDFGRARGGIDIHDSIGYNFKFTDLQACIGIAQMSKLKDRVVRKKQIWQRYSDLLVDISQVRLFNHNLEFTAPWFIDALVENRDELMVFLKNREIGSRSMYPPINSQGAYQREGSYPVSETIGISGLWLPSYVQISDEEISLVCTSISEFYA